MDERDLITVKNVSLKKATFVKFRAQSVDFLEVHNPRALLEVAMRSFTCLTVGDIIRIPHGDRTFDLEVREVLPDGAASVVETDCNVEFDEPLGYKESKYAEYERKKQEEEAKKAAAALAPRPLQRARFDTGDGKAEESVFKAFSGAARRVDGKLAPGASAASAGAETAAGTATESKSGEVTPATPSVGGASPAAIPQVTYKSSIGDKYSKKKVSVSAFTGPARKLSG